MTDWVEYGITNPYWADNLRAIYNGDCRSMSELADGSVQCVITSPPYWGLRKYSGEQELIWGGDENCEHSWEALSTKEMDYVQGNPEFARPHREQKNFTATTNTCSLCGAWKGAYGLEPTPEMYIQHTIEILREIRRVLRKDGVVFWNIGDSYAGSWGNSGSRDGGQRQQSQEKIQRKAWDNNTERPASSYKHQGLKPKDLCLIPFRVAIAAQEDGWWVRSVIIWCLSGGMYVYARTQKGDMPVMIRDIARLQPSTIKLWNGTKWTQVKGISKSNRKGDEIELVLRSGERIACSPNHRFPTNRGLLEASQIVIGDKLERWQLPQPRTPLAPFHIGLDAMWLAGLYIAEGSMSDDTIQIAGHVKEVKRWERLQKIAESYGGNITRTITGNKMDIRLYGKVLTSLIKELVSGHTAKDKCFAPVVWRYSDGDIQELLQGYLDGDGHWDERNCRWRLGFTRNYNLERDLRTVCARLGYRLTLNLSVSTMNGKRYPSFRGEIRTTQSNHHNAKSSSEVVAIRRARCREIYDIGVEDEPHTFALASGIITHNSKPNPMPESVTDRPTESHEYILMLTKNSRYYWDADAVREPNSREWGDEAWTKRGVPLRTGNIKTGENREDLGIFYQNPAGRNIHSVWEFPTQPYPEAHFAVFPEKLPEICIKAATPEVGCCNKCGVPWARIIEKGLTAHDGTTHGKSDPNDKSNKGAYGRLAQLRQAARERGGEYINTQKTLGWKPSCNCNTIKPPVPSLVLDPFMGSGTVLEVAAYLGRKSIGCDISTEYCDLAVNRNRQSVMELKV